MSLHDEVRIRSQLTRLQPQNPASDDELKGMRKAAWHKQGILVLSPDELTDPWERQSMINIANRLFGKRYEVRG